MKKVLAIFSFLSSVFAANSQNLTVEGAAPNLYITHTVAPKENFYSVGRLYNQNPKAIATFNNLVMEKGLTIGQHIKIPLNAQNLDANNTSGAGETLIPLTHIVAKNENLSKIGAELNVSAQTLKQWNNLTSDNLAPGTAIVVGHLKMSGQASVAKTTSLQNTQPAKSVTAANSAQPAVEARKEETVALAAQAPAVENKEATAAKQQPKQTEAAVNTSVPENPTKQVAVKDETVTQQQPKADEGRKTETYSYASSSNVGSIEGVFAGVFTSDVSQKSLNTKSGEAATFKSTSGWQDKKYYVLMNDVTPGTIVKIAAQDNKIVYAKVLGSMPDMKENSGLMVRISSAAASYLGIIDPRFPVQISYYQ